MLRAEWEHLGHEERILQPIALADRRQEFFPAADFDLVIGGQHTCRSELSIFIFTCFLCADYGSILFQAFASILVNLVGL
jgi:hypothetical protein